MEIAKQRNISVDTVMNHLADALEAGFFVDYRRGRYMPVLLCSCVDLIWDNTVKL